MIAIDTPIEGLSIRQPTLPIFRKCRYVWMRTGAPNIQLFFFLLALSFPIPFTFGGNVFSVDKVFQLAQKSRTVDEFMAALPKDMRSNFSLMHTTRNRVQFASATQPRIILSSSQGDILLSFSGATDKPGSQRIEMIAYDAQSSEYQFHTIEFGDTNKSGSGIPIIRKNEQACNSCHHGAPIWDTYSDWPGAYGAVHDIENWEKKSLRQKIRNFLSQSANAERYRHLIGLEKSVRDNGYAEKNGELSSRLGSVQRQRFFSKIDKLPNNKEIKLALVAAISNHAKLEKFLPGAGPEFKARLQDLIKDTKDKLHRYDSTKLELLRRMDDVDRLSSPASATDAVVMARVRAVLEHFQVDVGKMSLSFGPESFAIQDGYLGHGALLGDLLNELGARNIVKIETMASTKLPVINYVDLEYEGPKSLWKYLDEEAKKISASLETSNCQILMKNLIKRSN